MPLREDWLPWVNDPQTDKETEELRRSVQRGRPFGSDAWQAKMSLELSLAQTMRNRGRQPKDSR
jgi:putative transposase